MLLKYNGFTLIEVLLAVSILFIIIQIVLPINILLQQERHIMSDRRLISSSLHDEIQLFLQNGDEKRPLEYRKYIHDQTLQFKFSTAKNLVQGCVMWKNAREQEEKVCYDAYQK